MKRAISLVLVTILCLSLCACGSNNKETAAKENREIVGVYKRTSVIAITDDFAEKFLDNKIMVGQGIKYNQCFQLNEDGSGLEYGDFEGHTPTQKIITKTKSVNGMLYVDETADVELTDEEKANILEYLKKDITWDLVDGYLNIYDSDGSPMGTYEIKGNVIVSVQSEDSSFTKVS